MVIGFTGTRAGMTQAQKDIVKYELKLFRPDAVAHGDCIGADADFDAICKELGILRYAFPGNLDAQRAHTDAIQFQMPKPPLERNDDIIAYSQRMFACPKGMVEELRSGTWATIRHAKKASKMTYVFYPDGSWKTSNEVG